MVVDRDLRGSLARATEYWAEFWAQMRADARREVIEKCLAVELPREFPVRPSTFSHQRTYEDGFSSGFHYLAGAIRALVDEGPTANEVPTKTKVANGGSPATEGHEGGDS